MTSTAQYKARWGNPGTPGAPNHAWYAANIVNVELPWSMANAMDPGGAPIIHTLFHKAAAPHLINALQDVWDTAQGHLAAGQSTRALIHSFGGDLWCGTYNLRFVRGYEAQGVLSPHAYGIAIDIFPEKNPMGKPLRTTFPAWYVSAWKRHGFIWGGDFVGRPDAMHFEVVGG